MPTASHPAAALALAIALAAAAALVPAGCASAPPAAGDGDDQAPSSSPNLALAPPGPLAPAAKGPPPPAVLPGGSGPLGPSEVLLATAGLDGSTLADVNECDGCHAEIVAAWRTSAHAAASFNNPVYRAVVDKFRDDAGKDRSRFCGGCHDIGLLVDGAMARDILPADPRGHAGITCRTCHSIAEARVDGNGSFTLTAAPIPIPLPGDAASVKVHVDRVAPLRAAAMCSSCHRSFLGEPTGNTHHLIGQDDASPWERSAYAGSEVHLLDDVIPEQDCRACHMAREPVTQNEVAAKDGRVASHRFLGAHTWLAAMRRDDDSLRRAADLLRGSVSVDIAAAIREGGARALPAEGAPVAAGERIVLDVVLRNQRVGHRFPGGVMDAQDAWIEVTVHDARGALLAESGADHEATGADPTAHRLRLLAVGDDGQPLLERQTNRFRAAAYNHTIPPRAAQVIEYALHVPDPLPAGALPLRVTARLRHRTRNLELQRAACAASKDRRGRAFRADRKTSDLDACTPQPVTTIGEAEAWIGDGWESRDRGGRPPIWRRMFDHALGMTQALQERRGEARPSLELALSALGDAGDPRARAMVMAGFATLAARQGRVDEALEWVDRATPLAPGHPALPAIRGEALAAVWRFQEAIAPLARAAEAAPRDDTAWVALAVARGSAGDDRGALDAAQRGLAIQPRDQDLLRVQALSLRALGAPEGDVDAAQRAYLDHRPADAIPRVRAKCSKEVPGCANERIPVHVHEMRPAR